MDNGVVQSWLREWSSHRTEIMKTLNNVFPTHKISKNIYRSLSENGKAIAILQSQNHDSMFLVQNRLYISSTDIWDIDGSVKLCDGDKQYECRDVNVNDMTSWMSITYRDYLNNIWRRYEDRKDERKSRKPPPDKQRISTDRRIPTDLQIPTDRRIPTDSQIPTDWKIHATMVQDWLTDWYLHEEHIKAHLQPVFGDREMTDYIYDKLSEKGKVIAILLSQQPKLSMAVIRDSLYISDESVLQKRKTNVCYGHKDYRCSKKKVASVLRDYPEYQTYVGYLQTILRTAKDSRKKPRHVNKPVDDTRQKPVDDTRPTHDTRQKRPKRNRAELQKLISGETETKFSEYMQFWESMAVIYNNKDILTNIRKSVKRLLVTNIYYEDLSNPSASAVLIYNGRVYGTGESDMVTIFRYDHGSIVHGREKRDNIPGRPHDFDTYINKHILRGLSHDLMVNGIELIRPADVVINFQKLLKVLKHRDINVPELLQQKQFLYLAAFYALKDHAVIINNTTYLNNEHPRRIYVWDGNHLKRRTRITGHTLYIIDMILEMLGVPKPGAEIMPVPNSTSSDLLDEFLNNSKELSRTNRKFHTMEVEPEAFYGTQIDPPRGHGFQIGFPIDPPRGHGIPTDPPRGHGIPTDPPRGHGIPIDPPGSHGIPVEPQVHKASVNKSSSVNKSPSVVRSRKQKPNKPSSVQEHKSASVDQPRTQVIVDKSFEVDCNKSFDEWLQKDNEDAIERWFTTCYVADYMMPHSDNPVINNKIIAYMEKIGLHWYESKRILDIFVQLHMKWQGDYMMFASTEDIITLWDSDTQIDYSIFSMITYRNDLDFLRRRIQEGGNFKRWTDWNSSLDNNALGNISWWIELMKGKNNERTFYEHIRDGIRKYCQKKEPTNDPQECLMRIADLIQKYSLTGVKEKVYFWEQLSLTMESKDKQDMKNAIIDAECPTCGEVQPNNERQYLWQCADWICKGCWHKWLSDLQNTNTDFGGDMDDGHVYTNQIADPKKCPICRRSITEKVYEEIKHIVDPPEEEKKESTPIQQPHRINRQQSQPRRRRNQPPLTVARWNPVTGIWGHSPQYHRYH
jgi:rubrerythrin